MSTGLAIFTLFHVLISLIGIGAGLAWLVGVLGGEGREPGRTLFLAATALTSVTGYFFPVHKVMPSHIVGAISLAVLGLAIYARSTRKLAGGWRQAYIISAVVALYFNVFVLVVQLFNKVPALKALAPTGTEGAFKAAQALVLVAFLVLGTLAVKRSKA